MFFLAGADAHVCDWDCELSVKLKLQLMFENGSRWVHANVLANMVVLMLYFSYLNTFMKKIQILSKRTL